MTFEEKQYIVTVVAMHRSDIFEIIENTSTNHEDREWCRTKERILHKALKKARQQGFNVDGAHSYEYINQQLNYTD